MLDGKQAGPWGRKTGVVGALAMVVHLALARPRSVDRGQGGEVERSAVRSMHVSNKCFND